MKLGPPVRWTLVILAAVALVLQFVPYGERRNPATTAEPLWDSRTTRDLVVAACYDCHSNQTAWPWYSGLAPTRWLVGRDVTSGRAALNFTEFDRPQWGPGRAVEMIRAGEMPPRRYAAMHPVARLTPGDRDTLMAGLAASLGPQDRPDWSDDFGGAAGFAD
jgi:hypothetical protein